MNALISYFNNNGLEHFLSNTYGLYLPMLISVIIIIMADKKELFKKENIVMFLISVIGCFILSAGVEVEVTEMINGNEVTLIANQVHIVNVFAIVYIISFIKEDKKLLPYNYAALWVFSFFSLWLVDGYQATMNYDKSYFDSGVGGVGIFDGLLLDPLLACTISYFLQKVRLSKKADLVIG
jgi:hypothetical protein